MQWAFDTRNEFTIEKDNRKKAKTTAESGEISFFGRGLPGWLILSVSMSFISFITLPNPVALIAAITRSIIDRMPALLSESHAPSITAIAAIRVLAGLIIFIYEIILFIKC
jgi:hypothetical protein